MFLEIRYSNDDPTMDITIWEAKNKRSVEFILS